MTADRLREIKATLEEGGPIACAPYVPQLLADAEEAEADKRRLRFERDTYEVNWKLAEAKVERLERENAELLEQLKMLGWKPAESKGCLAVVGCDPHDDSTPEIG